MGDEPIRANGPEDDREGRLPPGSRLFQTVSVVGLVAAAILIYSNTFSSPFLFDDFRNIVDNDTIRDPASLWPPSALSPTRHVGYASFAVNYMIGGLGVVGFPAANLIIHIGRAARLPPLAPPLSNASDATAGRPRRRGGADRRSDLRLPPVQTQAVTHIVQRFASLATFFYLLSLTLYLEGPLASEGNRAGAVLRFTGSFAAALLAMKTKEISATFPFAVILVDVLFFQRTKFFPSKIARLLPFLVLIPSCRSPSWVGT